MTSETQEDSAAIVLRRHDLKPRKRLGQNFLRDRGVLDAIVKAADLNDRDQVLEIGAGTGVLTRALLERAERVVAIELDDALYSILRNEHARATNLHLWHGNALSFEPAEFFTGSYKLMGNIPYYITGPLLRRFLEMEHKPSLMILMVQWEVAQRIVASPGNLSLLGVSVQFYAAAEIEARVPARAFFPVPKVDSAVLKLVPRTELPTENVAEFFRVVKAGFSMPRKQLTNSLGSGLQLDRAEAANILDDAGIERTRRAETLSIAEWVRLSEVAAVQAGSGGGA